MDCNSSIVQLNVGDNKTEPLVRASISGRTGSVRGLSQVIINRSRVFRLELIFKKKVRAQDQTVRWWLLAGIMIQD